MLRFKYSILLLSFLLGVGGCSTSKRDNSSPPPSQTIQVPLTEAYTSLRFHASDALALLEITFDNLIATDAINEIRILLEEQHSLLGVEEKFAAARKQLDKAFGALTFWPNFPLHFVPVRLYEGPLKDLFNLLNKYYQEPRLIHSTQPQIGRMGGGVKLSHTATVSDEYSKLKKAYAKAAPLIESFNWGNLRNPDGTVWETVKDNFTSAWEEVIFYSMKILEEYVEEETPTEMVIDIIPFEHTLYQIATLHCMLAYMEIWTIQNPSKGNNPTFDALVEFFLQSMSLAIVLKRRLNNRAPGSARLPWGYDDD